MKAESCTDAAGSCSFLRIPASLTNLRTLKLAGPRKHVLLVTLNRPEALNVFTEEMEGEMGQVLEWADRDDQIWYVYFSPQTEMRADAVNAFAGSLF